MKEYAVVIDIAKKRDFTVFMAAKDCPEIVKGNPLLGSLDRIIHFQETAFLEMFNGRRYREIVDRAVTIMDNVDIKNNADLLIDGDGIGDVLLEMMQDAGLFPIPILSVGGLVPHYNYAEAGTVFGKHNLPGRLHGIETLQSISVPKKDLVAAGKAVLEQRRLRICESEWKDAYIAQLEAYRPKRKESTGKIVGYEAENEADHDDIVSCFLMASWWFANRKDTDVPEREVSRYDVVEYEPMDFM